MYMRGQLALWLPLFGDFLCGYCSSDVCYSSHPRTFLEQFILPLFFLKLVRCSDRYHRTYRPVFMKVCTVA